MSTALVNKPAGEVRPPVVIQGTMSGDFELAQIVRQIKQHEVIAFLQLADIGKKLNRAAEICTDKNQSFETWVKQSLDYTKQHAFRLRRFADRIEASPDERVLSVFERAERTSLWLLLSMPDGAIHEVDELMNKSGSTAATRKEIESIARKYNVSAKVANAEMEVVDAIIENSLDQAAEKRFLESEVAKLNGRLEEAEKKVNDLQAVSQKSFSALDAARADIKEKSQTIETLKLKAATPSQPAKIDDREQKKLADAKRELELVEKKLQSAQANLAVEEQRTASITQLVQATEVWLSELSASAVGEILQTGLPKTGRDTLMSILSRGEKQIAMLKKLLA